MTGPVEWRPPFRDLVSPEFSPGEGDDDFVAGYLGRRFGAGLFTLVR
jgi:hypothetical protein